MLCKQTFQAFKSIKQHVNLNFSAYFETTCIQYTTVAGVIAMLACGGHLIFVLPFNWQFESKFMVIHVKDFCHMLKSC